MFLIRDFSYRGETLLVAPMRDFYITPGLGEDEIRIAYVLNIPALKRAMEILKRGLEAYMRARQGRKRGGVARRVVE
jgi:aspartate aminotransferase